MNFKNKHVFLISNVCNFFYLLADSLVYKCNVPPERIVAVVYKSGQIETLERKKPFEYINFCECNLENLLEAESFIPISLMAWNASIIKKIIDLDYDFLHNIYIFLTDDEVDRWSQIKKKNGKFAVSDSLHVTNEVLFVTEHVKNFIVPKAYFENKLHDLLGGELNLIDASAIFDILPFNESENLRKLTFSKKSSSVNRIMIGTKGVGLIEAIKVISAFKKLKNTEFTIFFMPTYKRIILDIYLLSIRIIHKRRVGMMYLQYLSAALYNSVVVSCSYLVIQRRGGGSTARLFVKWGSGLIISRTNSENSKTFHDVFGVKYIELRDSIILEPDSIIEKNIISNNMISVMNEEERSIKVLKNFFNRTNKRSS